MLVVGIKGQKKLIVKDCDTAKNVGSGELDVLATPVVASLVEETAWKSISNELSNEDTTVGSLINLEHISPTPIGIEVICETELVEIDNRKLTFSFSVSDNKGVIAKGSHIRFIVNKERFINKSQSKLI